MVANDLQSYDDRDGKDDAGSSPDPRPEQEGQADRECVEFEMGADDSRVDQIHGEGMNSDDGPNQGDDPTVVQGASAAGERWQQGEKHSKIRNRVTNPLIAPMKLKYWIPKRQNTIAEIIPLTTPTARLARRTLRIILEMVPTVRCAAKRCSLGKSRTVLT